MYSSSRLALIVILLAVNSSCALIRTIQHRYPLAIAAVLFLLPVLVRELGFRKGYSPRDLTSFDWWCILAGLLFLLVLPTVLYQGQTF